MSGGDKYKKPSKRGPVARNHLRDQAEQIARETGIPVHLAHQVALGNLSLNEVLSRMATRNKVDGLIQRYSIPKSLATQIALGQADLAFVLQKRRRAEHVESNRSRSVLLEAVASADALTIGLHGKDSFRGTITEVGQYEFTGVTVAGETQTIHKLKAKYACLDSIGRAVRNQIRRDKSRKEPAEPIWKPQDRYGCSDRRLFGILDDGVLAAATTLEGEVFTGRVDWMGRWEFGMTLKKKNAEVVIFRHALADLRRA
jgi:hypothetical protein